MPNTVKSQANLKRWQCEVANLKRFEEVALHSSLQQNAAYLQVCYVLAVAAVVVANFAAENGDYIFVFLLSNSQIYPQFQVVYSSSPFANFWLSSSVNTFFENRIK